jgi:hypothetical protein
MTVVLKAKSTCQSLSWGGFTGNWKRKIKLRVAKRESLFGEQGVIGKL